MNSLFYISHNIHMDNLSSYSEDVEKLNSYYMSEQIINIEKMALNDEIKHIENILYRMDFDIDPLRFIFANKYSELIGIIALSCICEYCLPLKFAANRIGLSLKNKAQEKTYNSISR